MKRIPTQERFWCVVNYRGHVLPTSLSNHRKRAIERALNHEDYGIGGTWRLAHRHGFRVVRATVTPHISEHALSKTIAAHERQMKRLFDRIPDPPL